MLDVNTIYACSAEGRAAYYTQYLTPDGTGERPGLWTGRGAENLGLAGEVTTKDLEALLKGLDPHTDTRCSAPGSSTGRPSTAP